jgi:hypothetical protein
MASSVCEDDDMFSDTGISMLAASLTPAQGTRAADWERYPFHRMKTGKMRQFRLQPLGTKSWSGAKPVCCEMCRVSQESADPLYENYQREWAYYKKTNPQHVEGTSCFYCVLTHRLRFKAYTRSDLSSELKTNDELFDNFTGVQRTILQMKRDGELDIDVASLPKPIVQVKSKRVSECWLEAPDQNVVTEAAFKRRNQGLTFKQAGVAHLVDWHEMEDGTLVQGIVETVGEAGVYKRRRRFGTIAEKETTIDNGQPQIDENQAEDNFQHTIKKRNAGQKKAASSEELAVLVQAALAKQGQPEDAQMSQMPGESAPGGASNSNSKSLNAGLPGPAQAEEEAPDDDAEAAADAALDCMSRMVKRRRASGGGGGKGGKGAAAKQDPDKTPTGKKAKSAQQLATIEERATKEQDTILDKFKSSAVAGGPFANKVKKLQKLFENCSAELAERHDEAAVKALQAWSTLMDICESVGNLLTSYSSVQALGVGAAKLSTVLEKPTVTDFMKEVAHARQIPALLRHTPSMYVELDLKLEAVRAISEQSDRLLADLLPVAAVMSRTALDETSAKALQKAVLAKLVTESLGNGSAFDQKQRLHRWLDVVLTIPSEGLPADLREELCLLQQFLAYAASSEAIADLESFVTRVKACQQGPLFHFRVSKLGVSLLSNMTAQLQATRSTAVYSRRLAELTAQIELALLLDIQNVKDFEDHSDSFTNIAAHLKFLQHAPKSFGKPLETQQVVKYVQFMEGTVLKCMMKQWVRVYAAAAKTAGSLIAGSQPDSAEAADPSDELFKICQAISAAEELLSAASSATRSWVPSLSGLQALWKLLQLAAAGFTGEQLTAESGVAYSKHLAALKAAAAAAAPSNKQPDTTRECVMMVVVVGASGGPDNQLGRDTAIIVKMLSLMSEKCKAFGNELVVQCCGRFKANVVSSMPAFRDLAAANKLSAEDVFLPFVFNGHTAKEVLADPSKIKFFDTVSHHERKEDDYLESRTVLEAWAPKAVRALQVVRDFSDAQVAFSKLVPVFCKTTISSCVAASTAYSAAHAKGAGQQELVDEQLVSLLADLRATAQGLVCDDDDVVTSAAVSGHQAAASEAVAVLLNMIGTRWAVAAKAACEAMGSYLPTGDWKKYAIAEFDKELVVKSVVQNQHHLKLAQLAEWLTANISAMQAADAKVGGDILRTFPNAISTASAAVTDAKTVVGLALVFRLVIPECQAASQAQQLQSMEQRASAATEVKAALTKCSIDLDPKVSAMLADFVTAGV